MIGYINILYKGYNIECFHCIHDIEFDYLV